MLDSFDRDIHYLRISVTEVCDLACRYCTDGRNPVRECRGGSATLSFGEIVSIVQAAALRGFWKVRLTGGEPLLRPRLHELVSSIKAIDGISFVGLTTNGTRLAEQAAVLKSAGLDGVNISLDTLDGDLYREITGGGDIQRVLAGIEAALREGFTLVKINMVVNDTTPAEREREMQEFCQARGIRLQRIREYKLDRREDVSHSYERPLRCGDCNRLRLTADGRLLPCLHADNEVAVDFDDIRKSLDEAIARKPSAGSTRTRDDLTSIGG
jgi:cyclic pyranopterin phosphate synthase